MAANPGQGWRPVKVMDAKAIPTGVTPLEACVMIAETHSPSFFVQSLESMTIYLLTQLKGHVE